jgi:hypothetical protein
MIEYRPFPPACGHIDSKSIGKQVFRKLSLKSRSKVLRKSSARGGNLWFLTKSRGPIQSINQLFHFALTPLIRAGSWTPGPTEPLSGTSQTNTEISRAIHIEKTSAQGGFRDLPSSLGIQNGGAQRRAYLHKMICVPRKAYTVFPRLGKTLRGIFIRPHSFGPRFHGVLVNFFNLHIDHSPPDFSHTCARAHSSFRALLLPGCTPRATLFKTVS